MKNIDRKSITRAIAEKNIKDDEKELCASVCYRKQQLGAGAALFAKPGRRLEHARSSDIFDLER